MNILGNSTDNQWIGTQIKPIKQSFKTSYNGPLPEPPLPSLQGTEPIPEDRHNLLDGLFDSRQSLIYNLNGNSGIETTVIIDNKIKPAILTSASVLWKSLDLEGKPLTQQIAFLKEAQEEGLLVTQSSLYALEGTDGRESITGAIALTRSFFEKYVDKIVPQEVDNVPAVTSTTGFSEIERLSLKEPSSNNNVQRLKLVDKITPQGGTASISDSLIDDSGIGGVLFSPAHENNIATDGDIHYVAVGSFVINGDIHNIYAPIDQDPKNAKPLLSYEPDSGKIYQISGLNINTDLFSTSTPEGQSRPEITEWQEGGVGGGNSD